MKKNEVPMEYRPLCRKPNGGATGSLEMWVEMMDSQKAGKVPRFNLQKPSSTDIEIRYAAPLGSPGDVLRLDTRLQSPRLPDRLLEGDRWTCVAGSSYGAVAAFTSNTWDQTRNPSMLYCGARWIAPSIRELIQCCRAPTSTIIRRLEQQFSTGVLCIPAWRHLLTPVSCRYLRTTSEISENHRLLERCFSKLPGWSTCNKASAARSHNRMAPQMNGIVIQEHLLPLVHS